MRSIISLLAIALSAGVLFAVDSTASDAPPEKVAPPSPTPTGDPPPGDLRTRKTGNDWTAFLGPTGDSKSREKAIVTDWPAEGPKLVWEVKVEEGYAMPAISRGRLFLFDRVRDENRLRVLRSETGEELWEFRYPTKFVDMLGYSGGPRCCPVVSDGLVYIVGAEGMMHCIDAETGDVKWKLDAKKEFGVVKNFFGFGAAPVIEGDLLIMQIGGSPAGEATDVYAAGGKVKSNGTGIVAFDKKTGKVKYKIADELASYAAITIATIDGRRWAFAFCRGGLLAFNPTDGKIDFHFPWRSDKLESVNASSPVVAGDLVFISECYEHGSACLKVKPGGYDVVWSDKEKRTARKSLMTHWMTPIHIDGYLYGYTGRHQAGELRCIELKTGNVMWSIDRVFHEPTNQPLRLTRSSLLYADGHLVCLSEHGVVALIKVNPKKFEPVAVTTLAKPAGDEPDFKLRYPAWAAPILSHGLLYMRGRDRLVCLELIPQK